GPGIGPNRASRFSSRGNEGMAVRQACSRELTTKESRRFALRLERNALGELLYFTGRNPRSNQENVLPTRNNGELNRPAEHCPRGDGDCGRAPQRAVPLRPQPGRRCRAARGAGLVRRKS